MKFKRWRKGRSQLPAVIPEKLTAEQIRVIMRPTALDPRFRAIDRYLRRWAVSQGSGLPLDPSEADTLPDCRPTPLSPEESTVADQIILDSIPDVRRLVFSWYRSPKPREVIARELKVAERAVYLEHKIALAYLLGRFTEAGIRIAFWEAGT